MATMTDTWMRLAFYPHLYSPILILIQMSILFFVPGGLLAAIFFVPLFVLSFINLRNALSPELEINIIVYSMSLGVIILTMFFPYLLIVSRISESQFFGIYLLLQLPLFFGHLYSIIYFGIMEQQKNDSIVLKEG